jgi:hypothetical protein
LIARPVHEETVFRMHHGDGHEHVADNSEGGDAAQESDDQAESAEELRADGEKGEGRWDSHLVSEEAHGAGKAVSAEPAQHLLCAVREKYAPHRQTNDSQGKVVARVYYFFEHSRLAF